MLKIVVSLALLGQIAIAKQSSAYRLNLGATRAVLSGNALGFGPLGVNILRPSEKSSVVFALFAPRNLFLVNLGLPGMRLRRVTSQCLERCKGSLAEGALHGAFNFRLLSDIFFDWRLFHARGFANMRLGC